MKLLQLHGLLYGTTRQMQSDTILSTQALAVRDRAIGVRSGATQKHLKIMFWLEQVEDTTETQHRHSLESALRLLGATVSIIGFFIGWGAGSAILFYDGTRPINILTLLTFFVFLPSFCLLLLVGRSLLAYRLRIAPFNLRLYSDYINRFLSVVIPTSIYSWAKKVRNGTKLHYALFAEIESTLVFLLLQYWTLWFIMGGMAALIFFSITTDLAFSWNVTPSFITPESIHSVTTFLSYPWSRISPESVPSLELIEESRYYRFNTLLQTTPTTHKPETLGMWWSFLILTIFVWGIVPRLIVAFITIKLLCRHIHRALIHLPGVPELLWRMDKETISTSIANTENTKQNEPLPSETSTNAVKIDLPPATRNHIVLWSLQEVSDNHLRNNLTPDSNTPCAIYRAGGSISTSEEMNIVASLRSMVSTERVLIYVKSWEPPLGEFIDFVVALRASLKKDMPCYIIPLMTPHPSMSALAGPKIWATKLASINNPWLQLLQPVTLIDTGVEK